MKKNRAIQASRRFSTLAIGLCIAFLCGCYTHNERSKELAPDLASAKQAGAYADSHPFAFKIGPGLRQKWYDEFRMIRKSGKYWHHGLANMDGVRAPIYSVNRSAIAIDDSTLVILEYDVIDLGNGKRSISQSFVTYYKFCADSIHISQTDLRLQQLAYRSALLTSVEAKHGMIYSFMTGKWNEEETGFLIDKGFMVLDNGNMYVTKNGEKTRSEVMRPWNDLDRYLSFMTQGS